MDSSIQQGSYRGVPFLAKVHTLDAGRRNVKHEYPFKEKANIEDMGARGAEFQLEFYVLGFDYMDQRDALIDALNAPGSGVLIHPWLKRKALRVSVEAVSVKESTDRQNIADFSVQFYEDGGNEQPTETLDTSDAVQAASDALASAAVESFTESYSVAGQPSWAIDGIANTLSDLADKLRTKSAELVGKLSSPQSLAQSIINSAYSLAATATSSVNAFQRASEMGLDIPPFPFTTSIRQQQAKNQRASINLVRQATIAAAASAAADQTFSSREDAYQILSAATAAVDAVQNDKNADGSPIAESIYFALSDLRSAINTDLHTRGLRLPELLSITPIVTEPALVIAHRLYGDANRDQEIIERNAIEEPCFVTGGHSLEVLSE